MSFTDKGAPKAKRISINSIGEDSEFEQYEQLDVLGLEKLIENLEHTLDEEVTIRNATQVEYDTVLSYFNVTEKNVEDEDLRLKLLGLQTEDQKEEQAMEIDIYHSKERYLQYSHNVKLEDYSLSVESFLQDENSWYLLNQQGIDQERVLSIEGCEEKRLLHKLEAVQLQERYRVEVNALATFLENEQNQLKKKCSRIRNELQEQLSIKTVVDSRAVDEKLQQFIFDLETLHNLEVDDIMKHYLPIFIDNDRVINNLEMTIEDLSVLIQKNNTMIVRLTEENEILTNQMKVITERSKVILEGTLTFDQCRDSLQATNARIALTEKRWEAQQSLYDELKIKYEKLLKESTAFANSIEINYST